MLALVARVKGTKNRKEALPRKENTTHSIYPLAFTSVINAEVEKLMC